MCSPKAITLSVLSLAFSAGAASAQLQFATAVNYPTPTRPSGVAAADFNADGRIDLAVTTDTPDRLTILLNTGNGTFATPMTFTVPNGSGLGAVVAGDINGNGTIDLAICLKNSSQVAIMLNNGSGQFTQSSVVAVGALPVDIKAGDIDGNGSLDLVTADRDGNSMTVLRNNGSAVFTPQIIPAGVEPRAVALGDLNNDGRLDAVVALHGTRNLATFLNVAGTFTVPTLSSTSGERPEGVAIADINNDGNNDVVFTIGDDTTVAQNWVGLFRGNGTGVLTTAQLYPTNGLDSSHMTTTDFNADGFDDVVVTNEAGSTISILTGSSAGLSAPMVLQVGLHPDGIVTADFNHDTRPDIAVSNRDSNTTSVILSNFCSADFNRDGTLDFFDYLDFVQAFSTDSSAADFNGDGIIDFFDYLDFVQAFSTGC